MPADRPQRAARPGSPEPTVKLHLTFEEGVRRAMKVSKPQEGFPDFRVRKRKAPKREKRDGGT